MLELAEEEELVARAKHDIHSFGILYEHYVDRIYTFVYRQVTNVPLAEDITAATFLHALQHLDTYENRGHHFGAWLYRIARNEVLQHYRRSRFLFPWCWLTRTLPDVSQALETVETRQVLMNTLNQLSSMDQEILRLHYFEDLSSAEVSLILGCSTQTIYVRLHRALRRLRKHLEPYSARGELYGTQERYPSDL